MTALELLDVDYPDPFIRFSAVRLLDTRIDDDRLLPVILQIVQVKRIRMIVQENLSIDFRQ